MIMIIHDYIWWHCFTERFVVHVNRCTNTHRSSKCFLSLCLTCKPALEFEGSCRATCSDWLTWNLVSPCYGGCLMHNWGSGWRSVAEGVVWGAGAHTQALYASRKRKVGSVQFYKLLSVLSGKILLLFFFHLLTRVESGVSETMCIRLGPIKNQTFTSV